MTSRRVVPFLMLLTMPLVGCGVLFTHAPPVGSEKLDYIPCSESDLGPALDAVIGGLYLVSAFAIAANPEEYGYYDGASGPVGFAVSLSVALGVSAGVGFDKVKRCRAARKQLAERQAQARNAPAPSGIASDVEIDSVRVDPATSTLVAGATVQLAAVAFGPRGAVVPPPAFRWSSSNDATASVSPAGLVTAHAPGSVVIAANGNRVVGTATVVVTSPR